MGISLWVRGKTGHFCEGIGTSLGLRNEWGPGRQGGGWKHILKGETAEQS